MVKVGAIIDTEYDPQHPDYPDARIHHIRFEDPSKAIYAIVFPRELVNDIVNLYKNVIKMKTELEKKEKLFKNAGEFAKYLETTSITQTNVKDICKYLMKHGLYYLIEESSKSKSLNSLYVGKTDTGVDRFIDHTQKKDWWTKAVVFFSSSEFSSKDVLSLERFAIEQGRKTRQVFRNINNSNADNSDEIIFYLEKTYDDICTIMDHLKCDLFDKNREKYLFSLTSKKLNVKMLYTPNKDYVLLPGSEIDFTYQSSNQEKNRIADRDEVNKDGKPTIMKKKSETDNVYELLVPRFFDNASTPAVYAVGHNMNGRNDDGSDPNWRNEEIDHKPLRDVIPKEN